MTISINQVYARIFKIWRVRRLALFIAKISPDRSDRLLDVGGCPETWTSQPPVTGSVDSLNIYAASWDKNLFPDHNISTLVGDGCNLEMPDGSYDIAFSNSVIEHVGTWDRQVRFAAEIRRVGNAVWVQTPAYECPVEPHYLAPFIHWFPPSAQKALIRRFTLRGILSKLAPDEVAEMVDTTRLLKFHEMKILFPDCEIHVERFFNVIPKSYIAVRRKREI